MFDIYYHHFLALYLYQIISCSFFFKILLNCKANNVAVTITAIISDTGSAKNTANTLSLKKLGKMKINGINNISFLRHAKNKEIFAWPRATKVC